MPAAHAVLGLVAHAEDVGVGCRAIRIVEFGLGEGAAAFLVEEGDGVFGCGGELVRAVADELAVVFGVQVREGVGLLEGEELVYLVEVGEGGEEGARVAG